MKFEQKKLRELDSERERERMKRLDRKRKIQIMRKAYETDQNLRNLRLSLQQMDETRKEEQIRQMQEMRQT